MTSTSSHVFSFGLFFVSLLVCFCCCFVLFFRRKALILESAGHLGGGGGCAPPCPSSVDPPLKLLYRDLSSHSVDKSKFILRKLLFALIWISDFTKQFFVFEYKSK